MGACRALNVMLGMSLYPAIPSAAFLGFGLPQWCVAGGIGLYIAGVTWFARTEARTSSRPLLVFGGLVMLAGLVSLAAFPSWGVDTRWDHPAIWPLMLLLLMVPVFRRATLAVVQPTPQNVQATIKACIFSIIVLDASVCLAVRGPYHGIAVLFLLLPTVVLGSWFRAT
jgi:4-hydroxybenzoate polyprenyltransferase